MNNLQSQLKSVSKSLAALSKQVEKLTNQIEKPKAGKKAAAKKPAAANKAAAKKAAPAGGKTVLDTVFDVIKSQCPAAEQCIIQTFPKRHGPSPVPRPVCKKITPSYNIRLKK